MIKRTAAFLFVLLLTIAPSAAKDRPNVLMIAVDDLRPMLGCYGNEWIKTPNIDRLAERSLLFERAFCQYAKCGTSRLSILSGLRPDSIGVFSNNDKDVKQYRKRRADAIALHQWFRDQGYDARGFGKIYHDGWDQPGEWSTPPMPGRESEMLEILNPDDPGGPTVIAERTACPVMQTADVSDEHFFAGRMTKEVINQLQEERETPFFFAVGYRRPHLPFVSPKKYWDIYQPDDTWLTATPAPPAGAPLIAWYNSDGYVGTARKLGLDIAVLPEREDAIKLNGFEMRSYLGAPTQGHIPPETQLELIHAYAACISYVDTQIGKLLDTLEANQLLDDTIIVFWADHGWHLGEYSAWGKMTNYEIATRVPFLVSAPGYRNGRTRALAELVDLYPTLCDLAGLDKPQHLEGESLLPVLKDPDEKGSETALSQYSRARGDYMGYAVRTEQYRYVRWKDTRTESTAVEELYDHEKDPNETVNVVDEEEYLEAVKRLRKLSLAN